VGLLGQRLAVAPDLVPQPLVRRLRVRAVERHQERQHPSALDVLQEPEPETLARMRALDDARNVGQDERAMARQRHHSQVGLERGEGVVRDLGPRGGHHREQRALARVGLTHQPDVGDELQHQLELPLLALLAGLPFARRLVRRGGESRVAPTAASAARHEQRVAVAQHLADEVPGIGIADHGARRHREVDVVG
jgi:hypothetical protein